MNTDEATNVVRQELTKYRSRSYVELTSLVDTRFPTLVIKGPSGAEYQVVIQVRWEGKRGGDSSESTEPSRSLSGGRSQRHLF